VTSYLTEPDPTDETRALYDGDLGRLGHVANYTRLFAHRPAVYAAWAELNGAIKRGMDPRRYELVTLAAARELRSSYCSLAHGRVLRGLGVDDGALRELAAAGLPGDLDEVEAAVVTFAAKATSGAASVTEEDVEALRRVGLDDGEILDVVLTVGARYFFSTVLDATGTRADAELAASFDPQTREALTVGRPPATGEDRPTLSD
jgi:uncharacterized peroxidase-related enzyme